MSGSAKKRREKARQRDRRVSKRERQKHITSSFVIYADDEWHRLNGVDWGAMVIPAPVTYAEAEIVIDGHKIGQVINVTVTRTHDPLHSR